MISPSSSPGFATVCCLWLGLAGTIPASGQQPDPAPRIVAPTRIYPEPPVYLLLRLNGDFATMRYTPGSLDRAANLQHRLELAARAFKRWVDTRLEVEVYVMSRDEWRQAGYDVPYGVPVRVGRRGLAAPAEGDDGTVALWADLLEGMLPAVAGVPIRGTPQQTATMILADFLTQLQMSEILVDDIGIAGDRHWVRGLATHVASIDLVRRYEMTRLKDLGTLYELAARKTTSRTFSARDYGPDLGLEDWLWFQAQFHAGAQTIIAKEGKGSVKKLKKLSRSRDGGLSGDLLLKRYQSLNQWFHASFTAVSLRR